MIFATSCTANSEAWKAFPSGTTRFSTGTITATTTSASTTAPQLLPESRPRGGMSCLVGEVPPTTGRDSGAGESTAFMKSSSSRFGAAALHREDALRALLDEDDDEDEHHDLGEHGALPAFEQLVQHPEADGGVDGTGELPDAAEHDHHERVDDVALAEVRTDVADLR